MKSHKHEGAFKQWLYRATWLMGGLVVAACGGGGGDDSDPTGSDSSSSAQQYPAGVWRGTSAGQDFFGIVDPGTSGSAGTGGFFYFARYNVDGRGPDSFYGDLSTSGSRVAASNGTYYTTPQDILDGTGVWAFNLALTGTVSGRASPSWTSANGTFSGSYVSPYNSAARLQFSTTYDSNLSNRGSYVTSIGGGIQGAYRGDRADRSGWGVYVDWAGRVTGRNGNCQFSGRIVPRGDSSPFYDVTLTLANAPDATCGQATHNMEGRAVVRYDSAGNKTGLWLVTRTVSGTRNTYVLDGDFRAAGTQPGTFAIGTIASTAQNPVGSWTGKDAFMGEDVDLVVLPGSGQEFMMYRRKGAGDVLYSTAGLSTLSDDYCKGLSVNTGEFCTASAVFWRRGSASSAGTLYSGVHFAGAVATGSTLKAIHDDPATSSSNNGLPSAISLDYVNAPSASAATLFAALLNGQTYSNGSEAPTFGSRPVLTDITVALKSGSTSVYEVTGNTSSGCEVKGTVSSTASSAASNMFSVTGLSYTGGTVCPSDAQYGVLVVDSVDSNVTTALSARLLTASAGQFTIFAGTKTQ
ncbi:MAG: hypothetical protein GAK30_01864 [Paracidovorax wautersii]|uniref:Uncharacterized protein n=1 Tax=Paracidovorax wautersii TaxID=1177982 RepID=A0A7V8FP23_9BURK|nr:MAG: hypothetical protein GAK30_01864 [Paracidovorax wautersii]